MERIDNSTAAAAMPTPGAAGTPGFFTSGNPAASVPATVMDQDWFNNVQEELISILTAAGTTPDKTKQNQVLTSLQSLFSPEGLCGQTLGASGSLSAAGTTVALSFAVMRVGSSLKAAGTPLVPSDFTSLNFDVATTGTGGMDTGVSPANTFVAIYGMRNPTTGDTYFVGTTACDGPVYTGANAPAGYTQSALHSIWPTNASGQLVAGSVRARYFQYSQATQILSGGSATTLTPVSLSSLVPAAAVSVTGELFGDATTTSSSGTSYLSADGVGTIATAQASTGSNAGLAVPTWFNANLVVAQTIYYKQAVAGGTFAAGITVNGFSI